MKFELDFERLWYVPLSKRLGA